MKQYCLSTAVLWWQNTLMLVAVQYCYLLIFMCIRVFILLTSLKVYIAAVMLLFWFGNAF